MTMEMKKLNTNPFGLSEQSYNPIDFGRMKADNFNNKQGELTGYDCPECLNRGRIAIAKEDGSVVFQECDCMKIRRFVQKMENSGLEEIDKCTFDAYKDEENWQTTIKQGAKAYADNPVGWLVFCGQTGGGKTHLCTAVCSQLLHAGKEVRYMPWRQDVRELKEKAMELKAQNDILKKYQEAPILFIDDLFKVCKTSDNSLNLKYADVELAMDILFYRASKRLTTIISTELYPSDLLEIDGALGSRICYMAGNNLYNIERKPGRNYRLRNVVTV